MKVSDHTMTIMTGLVLTVVVGMLAQNSESIMATFTGQNRIALEDDAFTVRAGKPQVIDILLNDQVPAKTDLTMIEIMEKPACGALEIDGGKFRYVNSDSCSGAVTFTYCHADDPKCTQATVALQVRPKPGGDLVVASTGETGVAAGPTTEIATAETQTAAMTPPVTVVETDTPIVTAEAEATTVPETVEPTGEPEVMVSLPSMPESAADAAGTGVSGQSAPTTLAAQDSSQLSGPDFVPEPEALDVAQATEGPESAVSGQTDVTVALAEVAPLESAAPERVCNVDMTAEPAPGGMIAIWLSAACMPDSPVTLRQGGFEFAAVTDSAGMFAGNIPAFATEVVVEAQLPDGVSRSITVAQPEADRFTRVAVLWNGSVDLDLRAGEYGAAPGQPGYVWSGDPRDWRQARLKGGGYLQMFGSPDGWAEVYTLPVSRRQAAGVVDLSLHVADGSEVCDMDVDLRVLRFEGGASKSSQVRFTLAPCGDTADEYEVVNALSDLRVAAR